MNTEFSASQFDLAYPEGIEHHWWNLARNKIIAHVIQKTSFHPSLRILDIGCGRGITVVGLRDRGIHCIGVELADSQPLIRAKPYVRTGMDAIQLPEAERKDYDTILLLDVIEHLPDPVAYLKDLARAFPHLSRIIITVPARPEIWSNYDDFYGHYRRYTLKEVHHLSMNLGWRLTYKSYFFHLVYLPARLITALKHQRAVELEAPEGLAKWVHKLIFRMIFIDFLIFPQSWVGTSLIACFTPTNRAENRP